MEFWGVEVKPGKPLKVKPEECYLIHLSQASLGESKNKASESVHLYVKVDEQKLVLGTLSEERFPQASFDLVFEKEFELSHNWKNGSIYFFGYKTPFPDDENEGLFSDPDDSESEEEELPVARAENGKAVVENAKPAKGNGAKAEASAKPKGKVVEPSKDAKSEDDDDEDDESEDGDSDSEDVDEMSEDDDDDDSEDEDEETPRKVQQGKKRANESATKTPVPAKKAKAASPQKTDGKKGGHTATPHPAKKGGKTPASQSPKSGGQFSCKSCTKTFSSEVGLQSHSKAKHGGK